MKPVLKENLFDVPEMTVVIATIRDKRETSALLKFLKSQNFDLPPHLKVQCDFQSENFAYSYCHQQTERIMDFVETSYFLQFDYFLFVPDLSIEERLPRYRFMPTGAACNFQRMFDRLRCERCAHRFSRNFSRCPGASVEKSIWQSQCSLAGGFPSK